jgi:hypothetical protein
LKREPDGYRTSCLLLKNWKNFEIIANSKCPGEEEGARGQRRRRLLLLGTRCTPGAILPQALPVLLVLVVLMLLVLVLVLREKPLSPPLPGFLLLRPSRRRLQELAGTTTTHGRRRRQHGGQLCWP